MSDRNQHLSKIRRAASIVELRMRLGRALKALPTSLTIALAFSAATLAVRKIFPAHLSERHAREMLIGAGVFVIGVLAAQMIRRLPRQAGTVALDKFHDLNDRLTNALAFEAIPARDRTALMEVAIDDACEHAVALKPGKASPIRVPQDLLVSLLVGTGVLGVALLEVRTPKKEVPQLAQIDALQMSPDDIELFKDAAKQFQHDNQSPEMKAAVDKFNQLIEDIEKKRLDRTEAFRKMEEIERELMKGAEADQKAFDEALKETADELKKAEQTKPLAENLEKKDFDKAKKNLKDMADALRDKKQKPDKKSLEKLRAALQKAASRKKEALAALNEKRNEIREQLLNKKQQKEKDPDAGAENKEEESLLKKKERELERLDRDAEQKERAGRQLDKLDRDLAKAAEDLMKDLDMSAQDLEQAAEDINRLQEEEMTDKEKEELRQRIEELRELLRQQGQGGKQRMARMLKFGKRARGGSKGQKGEKGEKGDQQEDGDDGEDGEDGDGKDGKDGKDGNQPGGKGQKWVIGPGGKKILIPGAGAGNMPGGDGAGQPGGNQPGGDGAGQGGKEAGTGHDSNLTGKRSDPKMGTSDVQEQGLDTHQGPSNSQIILSAAERGFKGQGYKKVFTDYHTVAEQQINKDTVPDGYRFYVHRYFQLIRPRE